ncbi:MAG: ATP-dependent DNA helicase, partial [Pseudonocardiaceae bacterium]
MGPASTGTGADHYSSRRVLEAEDRIVRAASLGSDFSFSAEEIEIAIREHAVNGVPLNRGQQELVHAMAGSSRRVRLALAPAGSGKTTAVRVLTQIWTTNGYDAIGLAPSAAAAAVLGDATGIATDTLAKLSWEILNPERTDQNRLSDRIDAGTLVVIDEAGLADTLTLDRVLGHCLARGATVRLLGDGQQLPAVGAGGTLRDIADQHGAEGLTDVVRFTDLGEAHATLDLRDGDPAAIGFYLDHDRVHATDQDGTITEVFDAWCRDRVAGNDSLMLAPTRDLVADLNRRARADRLGGMAPRVEVDLVDGNQASVGDTVLTRHNNRRLRVSGTDWVKNGDRWTITKIHNGALTVRDMRTGLKAHLPAWYVAEHVELGYASTVHTAQGVTADIVHGIVTGSEDRQMLYTMLTRGRDENHAHIITDPAAATPECGQWTLPGVDKQLTSTQMLEAVIARDGAAVSARTALRRGTSHTAHLRAANTRYLDAVTTAAQHVCGIGWEDALEAAGEGPLPWLAAIPTEVAIDKRWGPYVAAIAEYMTATAHALTNDLQQNRRPGARNDSSAWVTRYGRLLGDLHTDVALWRAAQGVPDDDRRP